MHELHLSTGASITAARYAGTIGTPAFFDSEWFPRLAQLDGASGAKSLIQACTNTILFDWPEAAFDLDTPDDVAHWK
jgi:molybdenum cofactor cytidylyltransferase